MRTMDESLVSGTYGRTSNLLANAPGLSGTTISHSYFLGSDAIVRYCTAVGSLGIRSAGVEAVIVLARALRRAAMKMQQ